MTFTKSRPGKQWEAQVGQALRKVAGHVCNSNNEKPACDWRAVHQGASVLVECKETESAELRFDAITDGEYTHLCNHTLAGGISLVLVSRVGPNWRRAWACTWPDWQQLERAFGRPKSQSGLRKVSLALGGKLCLDPAPLCFVELGRVGEAWDLSPWLPRGEGCETVPARVAAWDEVGL